MHKLYLSVFIHLLVCSLFSQNANIPDLDGVYQINHVDENLPLNTRAAFTQVVNFPAFLDSFVSVPKGGAIYCNMDGDTHGDVVVTIEEPLSGFIYAYKQNGILAGGLAVS